MAMSSLTLFCGRCQAQLPVNDGPTAHCHSCGLPVNEPAWFYAKNRQKIGPVSLSELRQLLTSSELQTSDMVLQEGAKQWVTAGSIPDLFLTQDAAPTVAVIPIPVAEAIASSKVANGPIPVAEAVTGDDAANQGRTRPVAEPLSAPTEVPHQIGRYRVVKVLGEGAFGRVYLAPNGFFGPDA
jgi:uncharacterized protein DUF4339